MGGSRPGWAVEQTVIHLVGAYPVSVLSADQARGSYFNPEDGGAGGYFG